MPQQYDAIIVGAGHNGLVTAAYLAKGYDVVVCPGYTPKFLPLEDRREHMDAQQEEQHDDRNGRDQRGKTEAAAHGLIVVLPHMT